MNELDRLMLRGTKRLIVIFAVLGALMLYYSYFPAN